MKPYIIFLGGTGARCMEALANTLLAGCAPTGSGTVEAIQVLSADSDDANRNLTDARNSVRNYQKFNEQFCSEVKADELSSLAGVKMPMLTWHTKPETMAGKEIFTLATLSGDGLNSDEAKLLADALYTQKEQEDIKPDQFGYEAHPNIGAAILQACMITTVHGSPYYQFFQRLCNDLNAAQTDVRLLIVGSLFGGTGAASFPTLVADVERILATHGAQVYRNNLKIGSVMIAPYFHISKDLEAKYKVQVDSADFDAATKQALHYYADHYANKFDAVYLLGSSPKHTVKQLPAGGAEQKNQPMILEMDVAQACLHYFSMDGAELSKQNHLFYTYIGVNDDNSKLFHGWNELGLGGKSVAPLARMIYFSLVVHLHMIPKFEEWKRSGGPGYFLKYAKKYISTDMGAAALLQLEEETRRYLEWVQEIITSQNMEQQFVEKDVFDRLMKGVLLEDDPNGKELSDREKEKEKRKRVEEAQSTFEKIGKKGGSTLIIESALISQPLNVEELVRQLNQMQEINAGSEQGMFNSLIHRVYELCCR